MNKHKDLNRQVLVVGGTGMLSPLCLALPPEQLIVAARFQSNTPEVACLSSEVLRVPLDYASSASKRDFLNKIPQWTALSKCVLWVHSHATDFSRDIINALSLHDNRPELIHVFGSSARVEPLRELSEEVSVPFTAVKLGKTETNYEG